MSLAEKPLWLSDLDNAFRRTQTSESAKLFYKRFPLGSIWQWNLENTLNPIIFSDSSATEKIQAIQQTELFAVNATDVESKKLSYAAWDKYLNSRFGNWKQKANGLQESHYREDLTFRVDGTLYSLDFLKKLNIVLEVLERFPLDPNARFLEIGGGFGQIGRMLRHFRPGSQYIAIDLSESLYFASIYLNLTCPNARIVWADTPEAVAAVLSESNRADMVLIPCVFMDQLASSGITVDAFINTSSLGEMDNATSRFYLQILQNQLRTKYAFLLNR
jgi:putative sugar O-methyltransferase